MYEQEDDNNFDSKSIIVIGIALFTLICFFVIPPFVNSKNNQKTYEELLTNVENKDWVAAKEKVWVLEHYKDSNDLSVDINYNYYVEKANKSYSDKKFQNALENYKEAAQYRTPDKDVETKINEVETLIKEQKERERIEAEKRELEEKRKQAEIAANRPSASKLTILSKSFGYSQYGEPSVVGQIKNNNKQAVYARADIELLDSYGNVTGTTYTYERVEAGKIWNFTAPTFGAQATNMRIRLSVDEE